MTDEPDLERVAREVVDENGVILYHENVEPGLNGFWVEAKDLRVGDVFLGANGELSVLINAVRVEQSGGIAVFNFEVEGNHNYFILAKEYEYGQTAVLVHNGNCAKHHSVSKFLGGDKNQPLTKMRVEAHKAYLSYLLQHFHRCSRFHRKSTSTVTREHSETLPATRIVPHSPVILSR